MKERFGETECMDQPTGYSRGDDGVFRERVEISACDRGLSEETALELVVVMPQEEPCADDDVLWKLSTFELFRRKRAIEEQLQPIEEGFAKASLNLRTSVHQKNAEAAAINALLMRQWKKLGEHLEDSLDATLWELERRGVLAPPVIKHTN